MSYQMWIAFMLACWVISISPGAGAIASMSSGLNYGFRHGYWNVLGLQLALVVQIAIVAAGVGVLFTTSPWAFLVVIWAFVIAQIGVSVGLWSSAGLDISTGLSIVLTMSILFATIFFIQKVKKIV